MFLQGGQARLGYHVDQIMPGERLRAIAANQGDCQRSWLVGRGDAYGAIAAQVEASTRSDGVYGVSRNSCRGVVI